MLRRSEVNYAVPAHNLAPTHADFLIGRSIAAAAFA